MKGTTEHIFSLFGALKFPPTPPAPTPYPRASLSFACPATLRRRWTGLAINGGPNRSSSWSSSTPGTHVQGRPRRGRRGARVARRQSVCSGCGHCSDGQGRASPTLLLVGRRLGLHRRRSQLASVRKEHTPVPYPGACVKARRFPLLSGVVCRWGHLGQGRRHSR